ncbi:CD209 antigen-like protein E [Thunnus albacares]|uniref:CD209 antigen-like protein E n=1 Tax=Thunnus albacares TaxID=8236 RepID=UPI001CF7185E|nr:CD209 antigen-like protein E [Thunnus albacares]
MATVFHEEESEMTVIYENLHDDSVRSVALKSRSDEDRIKLYRLVAVSFGLLCILQAALNISLRLLLCEPKLFHDQQRWVYFNGSFYYISSNIKTWNESRTDCLQRGADLVVVNSEEEQEFINQYRMRIWIGLTDSEREGTWKWVDGTPLTTSFWISEEPNDYEGRNEDCVETRFFNEENGWNDSICRERKLWICEKKMFL